MLVNNIDVIGLFEIRVKKCNFEKILKKRFKNCKGIVNYVF